jgi:hypothetical protein
LSHEDVATRQRFVGAALCGFIIMTSFTVWFCCDWG